MTFKCYNFTQTLKKMSRIIYNIVKVILGSMKSHATEKYTCLYENPEINTLSIS